MNLKNSDISSICDFLSRYRMSPNDLARICGINPSQMRQYALGIKQPSEKNGCKYKRKGYTVCR